MYSYFKVFKTSLSISLLLSIFMVLQSVVFAEVTQLTPPSVMSGEANHYASTLTWNTNTVIADGKSVVILTVQLNDGNCVNVKKPTPVYIATSKGTEKLKKVVGTGEIVPINGDTPAYLLSDDTGKAVVEVCPTEVGISKISVGLKSDLTRFGESLARIQSFELTVNPSNLITNIPNPSVNQVTQPTSVPNGEPNPYTSVVSTNVKTIPGDGKTPARFIVTLYDVQNNVIKSPTPIYMISSRPNDVFKEVQRTKALVASVGNTPAYMLSDENGMIEVDVTSTEPGTSQICFGLKKDLSVTSTFGKIGTKFLLVGPTTPPDMGVANPYTSTMVWDVNEIVADGKSVSKLTVQLYDGSNAIVKKPTPVYIVTSKGTEKFKRIIGSGDLVPAVGGIPAYLMSDDSGKVVIEISATEVGISRISIGLKPDLSNSENSVGRIKSFELTVNPQKGEPNPYTSVVTTKDTTIVGDGKTAARFSVCLYDAQNNVIKKAIPIYMISSRSNDVFTKVVGTGNLMPAESDTPKCMLSDENGELVVDITSTEPGTSQISFGLKKDLSLASTFGKIGTKVLTVEAANSINVPEEKIEDIYSCTAIASAKQISLSGKKVVQYSIQLYDSEFNPVSIPTDVYFMSSRMNLDKFSKVVGVGQIKVGKPGEPIHLKCDKTGKLVVRVTSSKIGESKIFFGLDEDLNTDNLLKQFKLKVVK